MRNIERMLVLCLLSTLLLTGCDVHEFPELKESISVYLRLTYDSELTEWEHVCDGKIVTESGLGRSYDNQLKSGKIRYIVRAYPITAARRASLNYSAEFCFTKDIAEGYDHGVTIDLPPGQYEIKVWSDLVTDETAQPYYDATDFTAITLRSPHCGCTDYRDAFRGSGIIETVADFVARSPDTLDISMGRPLAKYEFVTSDVVEFIRKEAMRIAAKSNSEKGAHIEHNQPSRAVDIEDYKVVFYYVSHMPQSYNLHSDAIEDSSKGVIFESTLKRMTDKEAVIGFDYVIVNDRKGDITVQIATYDSEGEQISLTENIKIPLQRNHHTIIRGSFLMSEASGGVSIDPEFEDDFNYIYK